MTMSLSELRNDLHDRSDLQAARLGISGAGVNDAADAFRHALSSAILARDYGPGIAENLGVIFEILAVIERGPQEEPASRMDVWNNSVGREIQHNLGPNATDEQLADAVAAALGNGRLVITPDASASASVVSKSIGTTPDPLVKTIHYVDPLILDLDGDGLEITPLSKGVLFDTDGDSIKTGTAWAGADGGLLVWDRNGNGQIDNGAELFGDETILANGQIIRAGGGVFDASNGAFTQVRLWQDLSQNGISHNELSTLAANGMASIALAPIWATAIPSARRPPSHARSGRPRRLRRWRCRTAALANHDLFEMDRSITAREIQTGRRRVNDFLLSPVRQRASER